MFEIGFSEILVIMAIALVVLGPEKLPKLAATVGRWMGRAKAMARQFREQLEEEANKLELTKELNKQVEAAKRQLDIAKSLGLNESLEPAKRTPAPEGVLAGEPAPDAVAASPEAGLASAEGMAASPEPASPAGETAPPPSEPAPSASEDASALGIEIPVADAPAAPERVSNASLEPPPSPSPIEASVDSVHERRH